MKNHIVAVGISKYQNINHLQFANKDASEFYSLFIANVGNLGYTKILTDSEASLAAILASLGSELQRAIEPNDTFFFFFSGHGAISSSRSGAGLANYLLPFDATPDIENTSISVEYLSERFGKIKCSNKIVVIDSCFSGSSNSKAFNKFTLKSGQQIKTFENTLLSKGNITFTACKHDEEAIEDNELQNGLFTHYFLIALQDESFGTQIPLSSVHAPVAKSVSTRAKESHGMVQTPTFNGFMEGVVSLPIFRKRVTVSPSALMMPSHLEIAQMPTSVIELKVEDAKLQSDVATITQLLRQSTDTNTARDNYMLRAYLDRVITDCRKSFEQQFETVGGDASLIPQAIVKFEVDSYPLIIAGYTITIFGNNQQLEIYTQKMSELLNFGARRSGLVGLIELPDVIVVDILYLIGIMALTYDKIEPLKTLFSTKIYDSSRYAYYELSRRYNIHYADALGGAATKTGDHVREFLNNSGWIKTLCPELSDKLDDFQVQCNFIFGLIYYSKGSPIFADFGRFYGSRIMPLVARIRDDTLYRKQIAQLVDREENTIIDFIKEYLTVSEKGFSSFFWHSVTPNIFDNIVDFQ